MLEDYLTINFVDCNEDYDRQILNNLLVSDLAKNIDKQTEKMLKIIKKNSTITKGNKVTYELSVVCKNNKFGRFYPVQNQCSIGRIKSEIRSALMVNKYWDLDMVNCHYYICKWYCIKNSLDYDYINQYINNRERILSLISTDRDYSKKIMLKILYGGNTNSDLDEIYNDWEQNDFMELNLDYKTYNQEAKTFIACIEKEIQQIHKHIYDNNCNCSEFGEIVKVCNKKKKKIEKTLVAIVLQSYERALLLCIKEKLGYLNRSMDVLIHDGGLVKKLDNENAFPKEYLEQIEQYVKEHTEVDIKLAIKPMNYDNIYFNELTIELDNCLSENNEQNNLYNKQKIEFEKYNCKILYPKPHYITIENDFICNIFKKKDMILLHEDLLTDKTHKINGNLQKIPFFDEWSRDPNKLTYDRTTFQPNQSKKILEKHKLFNLWRGWKIDNELNDPIDLDFTTTFIYYHIWSTWCNKNEKIYTWIMMFLHNLIFKTYNRPNVALIIHSARQGAGKSSIFEEIIANILGDDFCAIVGTADKAFSHFNAHIANKCLIVVNETASSDTKNDIETIKDRITAKTIGITPKGVDTFYLTNTSHIVFCSNNDNPIEISFSDRRFMAISIEDNFKDNPEYTEKYKKDLTCPIVRKSFYYYLKNNYDSTNFNFKEERVQTDFYNSMKQLSIPVHINFIDELVNGDHCNVYSSSDLFSMFTEYCDKGNYRLTLNKNNFSVRICNISGIEKRKISKTLIYIDDVKVKKYLETEYNISPAV